MVFYAGHSDELFVKITPLNPRNIFKGKYYPPTLNRWEHWGSGRRSIWLKGSKWWGSHRNLRPWDRQRTTIPTFIWVLAKTAVLSDLRCRHNSQPSTASVLFTSYLFNTSFASQGPLLIWHANDNTNCQVTTWLDDPREGVLELWQGSAPSDPRTFQPRANPCCVLCWVWGTC